MIFGLLAMFELKDYRVFIDFLRLKYKKKFTP